MSEELKSLENIISILESQEDGLTGQGYEELVFELRDAFNKVSDLEKAVK